MSIQHKQAPLIPSERSLFPSLVAAPFLVLLACSTHQAPEAPLEASTPPPETVPVNKSASEAVTLQVGSEAQGTLAAGDGQLSDGEYADLYQVNLTAGQQISLDMRSSELDPFLIVVSPSGTQTQNDDWEDDRHRSRLEWRVEESGLWQVIATSYQAGEAGSYTLLLDNSTGDTQAEGAAPDRWSGSLASGDDVLDSGELTDSYTVNGTAGEHWILDLRSSDFDPYLGVRFPGGDVRANDDFEGDQNRSLLDLHLAEDGEYSIQVTSYQAGETGAYDLSLRRDGSEEEGPGQGTVFTGNLGAGDEQLSDGEWFETHPIEGLPGQALRIEMRGDFDSYLGLMGPNGFHAENDDGPEGQAYSLLEEVLPEAGTYTLIATSYEANQGGDYRISVEGVAQTASSSSQRDTSRLQADVPAMGSLEEGDLQIGTGEFVDIYAINVEAGQALVVTMDSEELDPYLTIELPDGTREDNDDWQGRRDQSRIEIVSTQSGQARIGATSYASGDSGSYTLSVAISQDAANPQTPSSGAPRLFGVFAGISDYPGDGDLDQTREDAEKLYASLPGVGMRAEDSVLLVDENATRARLESAVRELGSRMTEEDILVFFFSGHGSRVARDDTPRDDPDGWDETISLYDGDYLDDELDQLLTSSTRGTVLVVLDSCLSGGFGKDVVSSPGRMGLFSSEEDVLSAVPDKFVAGGYLSHFFQEGVGQKQADTNQNREITALELSQYIRERYRNEVVRPQNKGRSSSAVLDFGNDLNYQHLEVVRSVPLSKVLFSW